MHNSLLIYITFSNFSVVIFQCRLFSLLYRPFYEKDVIEFKVHGQIEAIGISVFYSILREANACRRQ